MSDTRYAVLRDKLATMRAEVNEAALDCGAAANLSFPDVEIVKRWLAMAARLRAILDKAK